MPLKTMCFCTYIHTYTITNFGVCIFNIKELDNLTWIRTSIRSLRFNTQICAERLARLDLLLLQNLQ